MKSCLKSWGGKTFIAGAIPKEVLELAKKYKVEIVDILEKEELAVLNAIPSAEGALQVAMEASDITLHGSKVLVLGHGRIAKILAKMLVRHRFRCVCCC